jgi:hypothetical protein
VPSEETELEADAAAIFCRFRGGDEELLAASPSAFGLFPLDGIF